MLRAEVATAKPVSSMMAAWLLMIPLFFFACRGILWFQGAEGNSLEGTGFNTTTAAKGAGTAFVLVFVFCCVLLLLSTRINSILRICRENKLFVTLALYSLASCVWSQFPSLTLQFGIYIILNVLFVFYLLSRFTPLMIMKIFYAMGWIVVVSSITFALALPRYGIDHRASTEGAWQGIFVYKQPCAIMCTFLLSVAFYLPATSGRSKFLRALFVTMTIFLIYMTQARTGWVLLASLLLYVCVMKLLTAFRSSERAPIIAVLFICFTAAVALLGANYRSILLALGKDVTLTGRTEIWQLVMTSVLKRPILGYGYRAFWNGLQGESANLALTVGWTPTGAHNGYLDVWLNLGIIGLVIVLITFAFAFRDGVTCLQNNLRTPGFAGRDVWYLSIIFLTFIVNMVEYTVMIPNYLAWMMYILACVGLASDAREIRVQARA